MAPSNSAEFPYTEAVFAVMQRAGVPSFLALSRQAQVSVWQVEQLRRGKVGQIRLDTLQRLSQALQLSLLELLRLCGAESSQSAAAPASATTVDVPALHAEYQRLQAQLHRQTETLQQEFQQASLAVLESWLIQWPTIAYAVQQNPQLPASKVLPLVRPVEQLVNSWGVAAIAPVGAEVPFDPQAHQLMEGMAAAGDRVKIRYTGYRQGDRLLYRAKVSPVV